MSIRKSFLFAALAAVCFCSCGGPLAPEQEVEYISFEADLSIAFDPVSYTNRLCITLKSGGEGEYTVNYSIDKKSELLLKSQNGSVLQNGSKIRLDRYNHLYYTLPDALMSEAVIRLTNANGVSKEYVLDLKSLDPVNFSFSLQVPGSVRYGSPVAYSLALADRDAGVYDITVYMDDEQVQFFEARKVESTYSGVISGTFTVGAHVLGVKMRRVDDVATATARGTVVVMAEGVDSYVVYTTMGGSRQTLNPSSAFHCRMRDGLKGVGVEWTPEDASLTGYRFVSDDPDRVSIVKNPSSGLWDFSFSKPGDCSVKLILEGPAGLEVSYPLSVTYVDFSVKTENGVLGKKIPFEIRLSEETPSGYYDVIASVDGRQAFSMKGALVDRTFVGELPAQELGRHNLSVTLRRKDGLDEYTRGAVLEVTGIPVESAVVYVVSGGKRTDLKPGTAFECRMSDKVQVGVDWYPANATVDGCSLEFSDASFAAVTKDGAEGRWNVPFKNFGECSMKVIVHGPDDYAVTIPLVIMADMSVRLQGDSDKLGFSFSGDIPGVKADLTYVMKYSGWCEYTCAETEYTGDKTRYVDKFYSKQLPERTASRTSGSRKFSDGWECSFKEEMDAVSELYEDASEWVMMSEDVPQMIYDYKAYYSPSVLGGTLYVDIGSKNKYLNVTFESGECLTEVIVGKKEN